jgi:hypothetical protein
MADPVCPEGFDLCQVYGMGGAAPSLCTIECMDDMDCPADPDATATPICGTEGPPQLPDRCELDCAGDATCPDGMECQSLFMNSIDRCVYVNN